MGYDIQKQYAPCSYQYQSLRKTNILNSFLTLDLSLQV